MIVGDRHSTECRLHRCPNCHGVEALKEYLENATLTYIEAGFVMITKIAKKMMNQR